jgi:hypothetical protein
MEPNRRGAGMDDMVRRSSWLLVVALIVVGAAVLARPSRGAGSCAALDRGMLPEWARTGFSDKEPRIAHRLGRHGRIVAILFGDLVAPPTKDSGNKILWVAKDPVKALSDLRISAQRVHDGRPVGRPVVRVVVGGPGPSGIDLPKPGCWRMKLSWAGRTDELELRYRSSASKGA